MKEILSPVHVLYVEAVLLTLCPLLQTAVLGIFDKLLCFNVKIAG